MSPSAMPQLTGQKSLPEGEHKLLEQLNLLSQSLCLKYIMNLLDEQTQLKCMFCYDNSSTGCFDVTGFEYEKLAIRSQRF